MKVEINKSEKILLAKGFVVTKDGALLKLIDKGGIVERDTTYPAWIHAVYDRYAGLLFSVLTDLCHSKQDAEIALLQTFKSLYIHKSIQPCKEQNFIPLVKLAIKTARQHVSVKDPVCIRCFERSTLLHYFVCENGCMAALCRKSGLPATDIARQLRLEIQRIRIKE